MTCVCHMSFDMCVKEPACTRNPCLLCISRSCQGPSLVTTVRPSVRFCPACFGCSTAAGKWCWLLCCHRSRRASRKGCRALSKQQPVVLHWPHKVDLCMLASGAQNVHFIIRACFTCRYGHVSLSQLFESHSSRWWSSIHAVVACAWCVRLAVGR